MLRIEFEHFTNDYKVGTSSRQRAGFSANVSLGGFLSSSYVQVVLSRFMIIDLTAWAWACFWVQEISIPEFLFLWVIFKRMPQQLPIMIRFTSNSSCLIDKCNCVFWFLNKNANCNWNKKGVSIFLLFNTSTVAGLQNNNL